jgi:hypothetical protein
VKFAELTQVALLGTERQAVSAAASNSALGQLQSQIDVNQRERALLSMAALSGIHEQTGSLPAIDHAPLPVVASPEQQPRVSEHAGSLLLRLISGECIDLLPEWLALAATAKTIAPPEALPALLSQGVSKPEFKEAILPVLGERGCWLAGQNPEWSWVLGAASDDESLWQTGDRPIRLPFLERLRKSNPSRARELLSQTWNTEPPEDRASFVATFASGLCADDEAFLEAALDDKRKEVRRNAAFLLARLPESMLVKRAVERAKLLLKFIPGASGSLLKLKKAKPANIEIMLPAECDKAMQRDGIEPKPPAGFGEKAWWLIQLLEITPLDFWVTAWSATPAQIVEASQAGEWNKEFLEAWIRAAVRQNNADWAEILFAWALEMKRIDKLEGLLGVLPAAQRESQLSALLSSNGKEARNVLAGLLAQSRHEWSAGFSRAVLAFMRKECAQESGDWPLRNQFNDFAMRLCPEVLAEAAGKWPTDSKSWEFWSKGVDEFLSVAQLRSDLRQALNSKS